VQQQKTQGGVMKERKQEEYGLGPFPEELTTYELADFPEFAMREIAEPRFFDPRLPLEDADAAEEWAIDARMAEAA
jgi:hypothetical protein